MKPFGQGNGTSSLPGGYTPPARFVRTVYQKLHAIQPHDSQECVNTAFHILEGVTIPNGIVKVSTDAFDYTQYTSMIDLQNKVYYFKTYKNPQIIRVDLKEYWQSKTHPVQNIGRIAVPISYGTISK